MGNIHHCFISKVQHHYKLVNLPLNSSHNISTILITSSCYSNTNQRIILKNEANVHPHLPIQYLFSSKPMHFKQTIVKRIAFNIFIPKLNSHKPLQQHFLFFPLFPFIPSSYTHPPCKDAAHAL